MKKIITLSVITLIGAGLISSCTPEAQKVKVKSEFMERSFFNSFEANVDLEEELFDATIVTYPIESDLQNYEYKYEQAAWNTVVVGQLDYGSSLRTSYDKNDSSASKVKQAIIAILSLGELKDKSYRKLQVVKNKVREVNEQVEPMIKGLLGNFPCYPLAESKRECKLEQDETTIEQAKVFKSCGELKRNKKKFDGHITEDESAQYDAGIEKCQELNSAISQVEDFERKVLAIRTMGKNIGIGLIGNYGQHAGFTGLLDVNSQESPKGDYTSKLVFNEAKTKVEEFVLSISFGNGYKEYSLENGGISNFDYGQTPAGSRFMKFTINGDYRIDAELSVTSESIPLDATGKSFVHYRLKGETVNTFKDGKVRAGAMALQIQSITK